MGVTRVGDDVQGIDTHCDEVLLSMKELPKITYVKVCT